MYSTGRSYTLWSPSGILITVWLLTEVDVFWFFKAVAIAAFWVFLYICRKWKGHGAFLCISDVCGKCKSGVGFLSYNWYLCYSGQTDDKGLCQKRTAVFSAVKKSKLGSAVQTVWGQPDCTGHSCERVFVCCNNVTSLCHQSVPALGWGLSSKIRKISIHFASWAWNGKADPMSLLHSWKCSVCLTLNLLPSTCSVQWYLLLRLLSSFFLKSQFLSLARSDKENILNLQLESSVVSMTFQMSFLPVHEFYITQAALRLHPWVFPFSLQAVQKMYHAGVISGFSHSPFPRGFSWINWILLTLNPLS